MTAPRHVGPFPRIALIFGSGLTVIVLILPLLLSGVVPGRASPVPAPGQETTLTTGSGLFPTLSRMHLTNAGPDNSGLIDRNGGPILGTSPPSAGAEPPMSSPQPHAKPPLKIASFTASNTTLDLGMSTTFTTVISGGAAPFTYQYSSLPGGCLSANRSTLYCEPTSLGTAVTEVEVTDATHEEVTANRTITVSPALSSPTLTSNRSIVTVGIPFSLTVNVSGGSPPLRYAYYSLPSTCRSTDYPTISCTPGTQGNYTIRVVVSDSAGVDLTNNTSVRVNAYPSLAFSVTPSTKITVGSTVQFYLNATGGTPPLAFGVAGLPQGCQSENMPSFSCVPNETGTYTVNATVTDAFGVTQKVSLVLSVRAPSSPNAGAVSGVPWWEWAGIGIAVGLIVAVALFLFFQLRRKPPRFEGEPPVPDATSTPVWSEAGPEGAPNE